MASIGRWFMRIVRQIAHVRQRVCSCLHPTRLPTHEILNFASFALQLFIFVALPVAFRQRFPMTMILQLGCFSASLSIPCNLCSWAVASRPCLGRELPLVVVSGIVGWSDTAFASFVGKSRRRSRPAVEY